MKFASVALLLAAAAADGPVPRLIRSGPEVTLLGGPSRDGRYLSYVDASTGDLAVRDLQTGATRRLTSNKPGSKEYAYFSTISPDSRQVAYAWFNSEGFYDLRVTGMDGSGERVLVSNPEAGFVQPCVWTPDGRQIVTLFFRADNTSQIALVPFGGGMPKTLRSLNWVYPKRIDISPDGRSLVYDSFSGREGGERTIFLLATDGGRETRLVNDPGHHLFPLWTPDGRSVVFASERDGEMGAWMIDVVDGRPAGPPRLLRAKLGRALLMGITDAGELYYGVRSGETDVFVTTFVEPAARALRATLRFPGRNTMPAWSSDGRRLAYLSRRGAENFGLEARSVVVRSTESDEERELSANLAHIERVRWAGDDALLVSGSDGKGRAGVFLLDAKNGALRPVVWEIGADFRGFPAAASPDGRTIYYLRSEAELRAVSPDGKEKVVHRGAVLRHVAVSMKGEPAVAGGNTITLLSTAGPQSIHVPFTIQELEWGRDLIAGDGSALWRVPLDGGRPQALETPGNRLPGFSPHPDGKRIALTAGRAQSAVWSLRTGKRHDR